MMVVVVLGLAVVAGACGQKESAPPAEPAQAASPAPQPPAQTPAATPADPAPASAAPAAAAPSPSAAAAPAPNALVQEHETGVEVTLLEARRTAGDSLTVKWRYRNTQTADVKVLKGGSAWSEVYKLTMGAFLVDPVNKKKYMVITDAENIPLASKHGDWQGYSLAPGQTLSSWAKFPAPPADVQAITVTLPGVPPFEDVPIVK
jgi:pyruvate/2-oxoglutarate dehydrogenase complex dihydrolipoamide acyltransferase (E2) component